MYESIIYVVILLYYTLAFTNCSSNSSYERIRNLIMWFSCWTWAKLSTIFFLPECLRKYKSLSKYLHDGARTKPPSVPVIIRSSVVLCLVIRIKFPTKRYTHTFTYPILLALLRLMTSSSQINTCLKWVISKRKWIYCINKKSIGNLYYNSIF